MEVTKVADPVQALEPHRAQITCPHCLKTAAKLQDCSGCFFDSYCGTDCQKAFWPTHKPLCLVLRKASGDWILRNSGYQYKPNPYWETQLHGDLTFSFLERDFAEEQKGKVAIEIGCGLGASSLFLLRRGWKVIAIDYFKRPLEHLTHRARTTNAKWLETKQLEIIQADIHDYQMPQEVDMVIAKDIFPYLNPRKLGALWSKIFNAIKFNGYLLGSFFDKTSPCLQFGAWTVDGIADVKNILTNGPYEIKECRNRPKPDRICAVIDFCAKKAPQPSTDSSVVVVAGS